MSKNQRKRAATGTVALALAALGGAGLHAAFPVTESAFAEPPSSAFAPAAPAGMRPTTELSAGFADLAEVTTPAVVRIEVRVQPTQANMGVGPEMPDLPEPFRRFFDFGPEGGMQPQAPGPRFGSGSGFLVSADGYIVTNDHVAADADQITVTLNDRRSFPAKLVGTDPTTDVAVIKIEATGLPHLAWGSSEDLRVGEWVMAVGNPGYGSASQLDYTVTTGIVSGKGRPLQLLTRGLADRPDYGSEKAGYAIENFIQTDAVINPGNSGGPLVNFSGQVVGVNSAIASTDGHYQGYGFAIPADLVRKVASDLVAHGRVQRAWLGVQVSGVTPEDAEAFGLPLVNGVVVQAVTEEGPAGEAGLAQGDVILAVDGRAIHSGGGLQELIATRSQGDVVRVDLYRDGERRQMDVRLGEAPLVREASAREPERRDEPVAARKLGLTLEDLDARTAQRLGYAEARGVVVSDVDPAGPAARQGIGPGARLVRIGEDTVGSAAEASRLLDGIASGEVVSLVVGSPSGATRIVNVRAR